MSTIIGESVTFFSFSSIVTGSMNSKRGSRCSRATSSSGVTVVARVSSKAWWSNHSALPCCTNRSGACRMNSSSFSLKRNSKFEKNRCSGVMPGAAATR